MDSGQARSIANSVKREVYALQAGGRRFDPGHVHQIFQQVAGEARQFTFANVVEIVEAR